MAEEQELTQAHRGALEAPVQQQQQRSSSSSSSTYRSAEHSQALLSGLVSLRDSSILFDVVLVVEDKPIEAHRILLAASCDYFRYAAVTPIFGFSDVDILVTNFLTRFMYVTYWFAFFYGGREI